MEQKGDEMLHDAPVEEMIENSKRYDTKDFDHFLIIWQGIPDIMEFYLVPNLPELEIPEWLPLVDDMYQGLMNLPQEIDDHITSISDALCSSRSHCVDEDHPRSTKWSGYMVPHGPIAVPAKTLVIKTGYMM